MKFFFSVYFLLTTSLKFFFLSVQNNVIILLLSKKRGGKMADKYNREEIIQKLNHLKKLKEKHNLPEIQYAISVCESYLATPIKRPPLTFADKIRREYYQIIEHQLVVPNILQSQQSYKKCNIAYDYSDYYVNLSSKEMLELNHDFWEKNTPKDIYKQFLLLYKQRKSHLHFETNQGDNDTYGECMYIPYYHDLLVYVNPQGTIKDAAVLAHEYGHGIQFLTNYHPNIHSKNWIFIEIVSTFFEYLFLHYYTSHGKYQYQSLIALIHTYDHFKKRSNDLYLFLKLLKEMELDICQNRIEERQCINDYISEHGTNIFKCYLTPPISEKIVYLFATSIVIELLTIYDKDPEKAFYILKKIMEINLQLPSQEYYNRLQALGLCTNNSETVFNNHLKRELTLKKR